MWALSLAQPADPEPADPENEPRPASSGADADVVLLFTGDTYGFVGRPDRPGGVARRKVAVQALREAGAAPVLMEVGNALGQFYYARFDRGELAAEQLRALDYDAINLGVHDFTYGTQHLRDLQVRHRLPFVSSNVVSAQGASAWPEPFIVVERSGVKVAVLGLCDPAVERKAGVGRFAGLEALSPAEVLAQWVPQMRQRSDVVVVLASLPEEQATALARAQQGIDVMVSRPASGEDEFEHEAPASPLRYTLLSSLEPGAGSTLLMTVSRYGHHLTQVTARLERGPAGWRVSELHPGSIALLEAAPEDAALAAKVSAEVDRLKTAQGRVLLSGAQEALGERLSKEGLMDVLLESMRDRASSEVAVINITAFSKLDYTLDQIEHADEIKAYDLYRLLWIDDHLVEVSHLGKDLKEIVKAGGDRLRWSGVRMQGEDLLVNGRPVRDDELYSVATSNYLVSTGSSISKLREGRYTKAAFHPETPEDGVVVLRDLVIDTLSAGPPPPADDYPGQWRLHIDRMSFQISQLDANNGGRFTQVPDARTQAVDLLTLVGEGRIDLRYDSAPLRWTLAGEARYSSVDVQGVVTNPQDLIRAQTDFDLTALELLNVVPFARASYETEFTAPPERARRSLLQLATGLATTWKGLFEELRVGPMVEVDFSRPRINSAVGALFRTRFRKDLGERLGVAIDGELRYRPWYVEDRADSLLFTAELRGELRMQLFGSVFVTPYTSFYFFEGKAGQGTGSNFLIGVGLSYSRLWKPATEPWF